MYKGTCEQAIICTLSIVRALQPIKSTAFNILDKRIKKKD